MRSSLRKCSRYSHHGEIFSSGRVMISMIFGCGCALFRRRFTCRRLSPSRCTTSSTKVAISGRLRSKGAAFGGTTGTGTAGAGTAGAEAAGAGVERADGVATGGPATGDGATGGVATGGVTTGGVLAGALAAAGAVAAGAVPAGAVADVCASAWADASINTSRRQRFNYDPMSLRRE